MQASDHITLTVFPFEDLSLENELGIFCRSFSAELITELCRFRQFQVISLPTQISDPESSSAKLSDSLDTD
jgi:TolB-like protein